ncbi:MAG: UbiD family decarboxylase, partial [Deltaproteobacteria bacterium]|nr:UbiD family decarboxylase [Deltaproteobacteria bacterium]
MSFQSLRDYIARVDQMGELQRVAGAHWDLEIGALTELMAKSKTLLFDEIPGYPKGYRVLSNVLSTYTQMKEILGIPQHAKGKIELARAFKDRLKDYRPVPPVEVDSGPVLENVQQGGEVDVLKFPTPRWHELDGGRFIGTGHGVVTMDPDSL